MSAGNCHAALKVPFSWTNVIDGAKWSTALKFSICRSRSTTSLRVGVWTRPTETRNPRAPLCWTMRPKTRDMFMPSSQSARWRATAAS